MKAKAAPDRGAPVEAVQLQAVESNCPDAWYGGLLGRSDAVRT